MTDDVALLHLIRLALTDKKDDFKMLGRMRLLKMAKRNPEIKGTKEYREAAQLLAPWISMRTTPPPRAGEGE